MRCCCWCRCGCPIPFAVFALNYIYTYINAYMLHLKYIERLTLVVQVSIYFEWMHMSVCGAHTLHTHLSSVECVSMCYYFKSCEPNNRHNRQHSCCYNAHLRAVPMAFVVHFMLLVFLFKLAIIDENSSIALNICPWSTLQHYVCMYLFVHLFACLLVHLYARTYVVRTFIHSFASFIDSFTFVAFSDESQHQGKPSFGKKSVKNTFRAQMRT